MPAMSRRVGGPHKVVPRGGIWIKMRRALIPGGVIERIVGARGAIHDDCYYDTNSIRDQAVRSWVDIRNLSLGAPRFKYFTGR
jgi:hypothetical protein